MRVSVRVAPRFMRLCHREQTTRGSPFVSFRLLYVLFTLLPATSVAAFAFVCRKFSILITIMKTKIALTERRATLQQCPHSRTPLGRRPSVDVLFRSLYCISTQRTCRELSQWRRQPRHMRVTSNFNIRPPMRQPRGCYMRGGAHGGQTERSIELILVGRTAAAASRVALSHPGTPQGGW